MEETTTPEFDIEDVEDEDDSDASVHPLIIVAGSAAALLAVGGAAYWIKKKNTERKQKFAAQVIASFLESNPHLAKDPDNKE